jgi:hypothetical protein
VTATEAVNASVPTVGTLNFDDWTQDPKYLYDVGVSPSVGYLIEVDSADADFWHGRMHLRSTSGQKIDADFALQYNIGDGGPSSCGNGPDATYNYGGQYVLCDVVVNLPIGSPAATWTLDSVELTDDTGATARYTQLGALPVHLTNDQTLQAGDFSVSPTEVDNWVDDQKVDLTLTPTGAVDGIASVTVRTSQGCTGSTTPSPEIAADGTVTVPFTMAAPYTSQCSVTGILVVDGAGDTAVYGTAYDAPALNLVVNQIPDTTAPVALSASLSSPTGSASQGETLTVDVSSIAAVDEMNVEVYDSTTNTVVYYKNGGVTKTTDGAITWGINLSGVAPGTYTVAFMLTDGDNLSTAYGFSSSQDPYSQPMPGGPLQFTVTAD